MPSKAEQNKDYHSSYSIKLFFIKPVDLSMGFLSLIL